MNYWMKCWLGLILLLCHLTLCIIKDFGYPQVTSTETLKSYVHNSPVETVFGPTESVVSANMGT